MAEVLEWPRDNPAEVAVRAADQLRSGGLVVMPTDTAYALLAHGRSLAAVNRLAQLTEECPVIALTEPDEVKDWLPNFTGLAARLARHCWPGPLTLRSPIDPAGPNLPPDMRELLVRDGMLSFRCVAHASLGHIRPLIDGPLLFVELPGAFQVEEVMAKIGQEPVLVVNDGPTYFGQNATVVTVQGRAWSETRAGAVSAEILADLAQYRILFVCTGNTCRSPLAMALCRVLLARRLGCTMDALPARGFQVLSAGLAAIIGEKASPEAVDVVREMGGDLVEHQSQPLTHDLLAQADCLFTMTGGHLRMLQSLGGMPGPEPRMLSPADHDVSDPIGCDVEVYRQCARQILECLEDRLPQILEL